jgi:hypothetical protein
MTGGNDDRMADLEARVLWLEQFVHEATRFCPRPHYLRAGPAESTHPPHHFDSNRLDASADNATGDAP